MQYQVNSLFMKKHIMILIFTAICLFMGVGIYFWCDPTLYLWFPKCPTKILTGWSCPGCGIQRAIHALLNGRLSEAVSYNYFFILSIPYALILSIAWMLKKKQKTVKIVAVMEHKNGALIYVIAFIIWFVLRNIYNV